MAKAPTTMKTVAITMACGRRTCYMVTVFYSKQMVANIKASGVRALEMVLASYSMQMVALKLAFGWMTREFNDASVVKLSKVRDDPVSNYDLKKHLFKINLTA